MARNYVIISVLLFMIPMFSSVNSIQSFHGNSVKRNEKAKSAGNNEILDTSHAIPGEYIIFMRDRNENDESMGPSANDVTFTLHNIHGLSIGKTFAIGRKRAMLMKGDEGQVKELQNAMSEMEGNSDNPYSVALNSVAEIVPNFIIEADDLDEECAEQETGSYLWGLSRLSMRERGSYRNATYVHGDTSNGHGVDVYVIDSGIHIEHEEFEGRAVWGYTASTFSEGDFDGRGHGTHVAGTIGGKTFGVAKGVNLIAVKALNSTGSGSFSGLLECLEWAYERYEKNNRPKSVFSMSLGGRSNYGFGGMFRVLNEAGIVVVASAGNDYSNACRHTPSFIPEVISVASSDPEDTISWFSNYGRCVDIVAPGSYIQSAHIRSRNASKILSGTSMAAPHVTGVIARYMSSQPASPSPEKVKRWLSTSATIDKLDITLWNPNTPNKLLHVGCTIQDTNEVDSDVPANSSPVDEGNNNPDISGDPSSSANNMPDIIHSFNAASDIKVPGFVMFIAIIFNFYLV